jgi:hypothetical protein
MLLAQACTNKLSKTIARNGWLRGRGVEYSILYRAKGSRAKGGRCAALQTRRAGLCDAVMCGAMLLTMG